MPTKMQDDKKGGDDRVKESHEKQQQDIDKSGINKPENYPEAKGDTSKDMPKKPPRT
ncbi:MAG: hypothetical protein WAL90_05450 [Desulfobacterales bacterium]